MDVEEAFGVLVMASASDFGARVSDEDNRIDLLLYTIDESMGYGGL